ncbi:hypothetical protein [Streptomyces flavofungini]|uniref:hypothetical protein n=1 Tax=Streptomyces flavofungini TaxID=68200 RepID=UPI0025B1C32A|nr:hypothetical protein [Streptomyces flavofungini]WJV44749.1 hypothetical protein QUY26_03920 [Streptomyces flavofungini]
MGTSGTRHRITLPVVLLATGALVTVTATSGATHPRPAGLTDAPAAVPSRSGAPTSTVDRVADFYGAYIDVLYDTGGGRLSQALRGHYLTAGLRHSLARWESVHHKDGVLRIKGVPTAWKVVYNDSGMGHCWSRVTLTWKDSGNHVHHTRLMVQSDLATRLISAIKADA